MTNQLPCPHRMGGDQNMSDLPFKLEPEFDYILTDDDRKNFAPKLATDDWWNGKSWELFGHVKYPEFFRYEFYRRRKSSGWVSVEVNNLPAPNAPFVSHKDGHLVPFPNGLRNPMDLVSAKHSHWQPWTLPALPQPPKPAAEVAFEEWWYEDKSSDAIGMVKEDRAKAIWLAAAAWAKDHKGEL